MRFSIAKLILATILINIVVSLTFAVPVWIGFPLLTFISLFVIPPAMIVGAVNTRGPRQAFFLGCMMAGAAHFIISIYLAVAFAFDATSLEEFSGEPVQYIHLVGYAFGLCGGLSGVGMYYWLKANKNLASHEIGSPPNDNTDESLFQETKALKHSGELNVETGRSPVPR